MFEFRGDMYQVFIFFVFILSVFCEDDINYKIVKLKEGAVRGQKYWNGNMYEFYGVPYAKAPTGRDKFKPPLPVEPRKGILDATRQDISCQQTFYTGDEEEETFLNGEEDCLVLNIVAPMVANETNLVPVIAYIHSGAFAGGSASMGNLYYIARRDVIAVSFNYRVGALGFACLGTEEIPGNAALKDQLAALKWIKKNIKKFGGNPDNIALAGYSVGATMAELHAISKHTDGLIDKLMLDSGSALTPFAINRDPISTAKNIAISLGYNDKGNIKELNEFYLNASYIDLASKSINFFLKNSTFGFSPCLESTVNNPTPFMTESPLDVLKKGINKKLAIITGFANMEGLSRVSQFDKWSELMNENFSDFLPADLSFKDNKEKEQVAKLIKEYYFKDEEVTHDDVQAYIDYFSDSMFKYGIIKSLKIQSELTSRPVYLYEFSYVGELSMKHIFMDRIKGASHRDQTAYMIDFLGYTNKAKDLDTRDRMTYMWTDFVKYEDPTAYESALINLKWLKYSNKNQNYLSIDEKLVMKKDLFSKSFEFWDKIYDKYYWSPTQINSEKGK